MSMKQNIAITSLKGICLSDCNQMAYAEYHIGVAAWLLI